MTTKSSKANTTKANQATEAAVADLEEQVDTGELTKNGRSVSPVKEEGKKKEAKKAGAVNPFQPKATIAAPIKSFIAALSPLARSVAGKSTVPVCVNVLLSLENETLTMATTNLTLTIVTELAVQQVGTTLLDSTDTAKGSKAGPVAVTLPYRLLADMVGTMVGATIKIEIGEDRAVISCGASRTEIMGISADQFPLMEKTADNLPMVFSAGDFKQAIGQAEYAAATDDSRPILTAVLMTPTFASDGKEANGLKLAATDGFRVAVKEVGFSEPPLAEVKPFSALVPASALAEVARVISEPENVLVFGFKSGKAIFKVGSLIISMLTMDGKFPDVTMILPKAYKTSMMLATAALLKAVKQAEVMAKNGNNVIRFELDPSNPDVIENLTISAHADESGDIEAKQAATILGPGLTVAFNVRFIREALERINTPQVAFKANDQKSPTCLAGVGDDSHFVVIMPMYIA